MKIGIDARFYGQIGTGIGRYLEKLIENLEKIDNENQYFILLRKENFHQYQPQNKNFQKILAPYPWYSLKEQIFLPLLLYKLKLDLVHFPHFNVPIFYFGKFIVTIHDLIITRFATTKATTRDLLTYKIKRIFYHLVIKNAVWRAKKILAVSHFTKNEIINFFKIQEEKIVVTYEAVNMKQVQGQKSSHRELAMGNYLLSVGNAYPHKNLERLLRAFKILTSRDENIKLSLQLVLVGKIDYFYKRLQKLVKELNIEDKVIFTGPVSNEELIYLYQNALVYVFPSLMEGFGLPGLEAMANGCPVISSSAGSLPEIYGQAALYFNPENVDEMVEKIKMIINNENLRNELREKGLAQVKKYSWPRCAQETLRVYQGFKKEKGQ